jgi:hypothetical protein
VSCILNTTSVILLDSCTPPSVFRPHLLGHAVWVGRGRLGCAPDG